MFSRYAPPAIDAINTYYSHGKIPIAIQKPVDNTVRSSHFETTSRTPSNWPLVSQTRNPAFPQENEYITGLTYNFPQDVADGSNTTDPVLLYRSILACSPDHSITIANIGFHDNTYHLLLSQPDKISPLSGPELVKKKVVEHVVQGNPNGTSFNFEGNNPVYAQYVLSHWPGVITYVPDAIGSTVYFGSRLTTELNITSNPVAYAAATSIGVGNVHQSWDCKSQRTTSGLKLLLTSGFRTATAMYYAVRSLDDVYRFETTKGETTFPENETAVWDHSSPSRLQRSIGLSVKNATFAARLEKLLLSKP